LGGRSSNERPRLRGSYAEFLRGTRFELIQPEMLRGRDGRFSVVRADGATATLLELPGAPFDAFNVRLDPSASAVRSALRPMCELRRMSTFAVGAILNQGVRSMPPSAAFVNVGTWHGFSLFSGMAGNPERRCIGIDNFSAFAGPREAFMEQFEQHRTPAHRFFDMDYEEYFATEHEDPIGVYFYDGDHAYEHQVRGLAVAERFFTDDCIVLVDDTNRLEPRAATLDFIAQSEREYEILLDVQTAERRHPTFWNGLLVFQATGTARTGGPEVPAKAGVAPPELIEPNPVDFRSRETLVSLVVCNYTGDGPALAAAIEGALTQTWPNVEVLVADSSGKESVQAVIQEFGDRVVQLEDAAPHRALEESRGSLVAIADPETPLDPLSVEAGLELPGLSRFFLGGTKGLRGEGIRRALAAGADLKATIPPGASFALAGARTELPQSVGTARAMRLERGTRLEALDETTAIARLDEYRSAGAGFAVFPASSFAWLAERPRLEERLDRSGACLLENDRVRIFALTEST
jgi:hypothetical protein